MHIKNFLYNTTKLKLSLYFLLVTIIISSILFACTNLKRSFSLQKIAYFKLSDSPSAIFNNSPDTLYNILIPSTVFNGLRQNGLFKNIFYGTNLKLVDTKPFQKPWFYSTSFDKPLKGKHYFLIIRGINYYADIWLNGKKIADSASVKNPFRQYFLNLDSFIQKNNRLIFKIYPPKPGDFTIGFVDWNPQAPDKEMGITRPVELKSTGPVAIFSPYLSAELNQDFSTAKLFVQLRLINLENKPVKGKLKILINNKKLYYPISLPAFTDTFITITPSQLPQLIIKDPKLWWPHNYGKPYLYDVTISFITSHSISDQVRFKTGIRKIEKFTTAQGFTGFKINGKKILVKGGGWVDNLFLDNSEQNIRSQLLYVKDMGLNAIRLEGFWGTSQKLYDLCDSLGIMILAGWSCHWEWEDYLGKPVDPKYGGIISDKDIALMSKAWQDQILWLRNHPSIIAWLGGSDKIPHPKFEKNMLQILEKFDTSRIYLPSAMEHISLAGPSGVKMRGPYEVEPPIYWFQDTSFGGAFGFNTETGPGAQIPVLYSIKRFIPPNHLWPPDSVWQFHCGRNEFHSLDRYNQALFNRYGPIQNIVDYAYKAQIMNYELMRPMFEAFSAHRYKATGVIQWMLNSAWPEFFWQLYDYYLMPTGAYYGAKTANRTIHAIYDYAKNCIYVVNDTLATAKDLTVDICILSENSKPLWEKSLSIEQLAPNSSTFLCSLPQPSAKNLYFLRTTIRDASCRIIDRNFYWLSTKQDILDYANSTWFFTPWKQYADFTALDSLPKATVSAHLDTIIVNKDKAEASVSVYNSSNFIAFGIQLTLIDQNSGQPIIPVFWQDNYFSLLPKESRTIKVSFLPNSAKTGNLDVILKFWNQQNQHQ